MGLLFRRSVDHSPLAGMRQQGALKPISRSGFHSFLPPFPLLSFLPRPRYPLRMRSWLLNPPVVAVTVLQPLMQLCNWFSQRLYWFTVYLPSVDGYICFFQETQDLKHTHTCRCYKGNHIWFLFAFFNS